MKRGSALLIVLGMASFMLVSAVSFAIYMRESRVPSSQLHRQVATRYLLKAALANAINRIDGHGALERMVWDDKGNQDSTSLLVEGVYDDPYPGVGPNTTVDIDSSTSRSELRTAGNHWVDRVFSPFGTVSSQETVPVLTLEALAYLPPAIINEVRLASRRTRTAKWSNLSYELGRYAFCAVNVSDCFDLNRLSAGNRRTSAPGERVNMSSLFRNGGLSDLNVGYANQLDTILDKAGDIPFVSLADFNLVAGSSPFSPFCRYIGNGSSMYDAGDAPALSNALFVTDTWFPPTNRVNTAVKCYNLAGQQPFTTVTPDAGLMDVIQETGVFHDDLQRCIGSFAMWALWDYLDRDHRPVSFCVPTTETVPMVVALDFEHQQMIKPKAGVAQELTGDYKTAELDKDGNPVKQYKRVARKFALQSLADGPCTLCGTVAFPFRRVKDKGYPTDFTGDVVIRAWWAPWGIRGRLDEASPIYPKKDDWNSSSARVQDGIVTVAANIPSLGLTYKDDPTTREALGDFNVTVDLSNIPELPMFWHIHDTEIDVQNGGKVLKDETYCVMDGLKGGDTFRPYDFGNANYCRTAPGWWQSLFDNAASDGPKQENGGLITPEQLSQGAGRVNGDSLNGQKFALHVAAWVRVKQGGKVVDIVPARLADDKEYDLPGEVDEGSAGALEDLIGGGAPVLEFRGDQQLEFSLSAGEGGVEKLDGKTVDAFNGCTAMFCNDPRFNWAPESWFMANVNGNGGSNLKEEWIRNVGDVLWAQNGRDRDIFMFTSDQEYLQSPGELMFLPYLGWRNGDRIEVFRSALAGNFDGLPVYDRRSAGQGPCRDMYWTSYTPEEIYGFDGLMEIVSGSGDFRINPFSDDIRVLMAALANTPYDYYVASTNDSSSVNKFANADLTESLKHAFNEKTPSAEILDDVMWDIAQAMHNQFRAKAVSGSTNWQAAFDDLAWQTGQKGDDQLQLFGVELDNPLYGVDRKFLHAYWRECFQNRQQLYLIFIRAEPMTVGGSSGAALESSQLGARGVALVWRDPERPRGTRVSRDGGNSSNWYTGGQGMAPHKTRILFYHQFD